MDRLNKIADQKFKALKEHMRDSETRKESHIAKEPSAKEEINYIASEFLQLLLRRTDSLMKLQH